MIRKIVIVGKGSGNRAYICAGNSCEICSLKFVCFTERKEAILWLDWNDDIFNGSDSPSRKLMRATHSKIWVKGSRKYEKLVDSLVDKEEWAYQTYQSLMH